MIADRLESHVSPGLAMASAARAPREKLVLPRTSAGAGIAMPWHSDTAVTAYDDENDLPEPQADPERGPTARRIAGFATVGVALVALAWEAATRLPDLLDRLVA